MKDKRVYLHLFFKWRYSNHSTSKSLPLINKDLIQNDQRILSVSSKKNTYTKQKRVQINMETSNLIKV